MTEVIRKKLAISAAIGAGMMMVVAGMVNGFYESRVWPGVSVSGIDIGNKTREDALTTVEQLVENGKEIELVYGTRMWVVSDEDLGVVWDSESTVGQALGVGRSGKIAEDMRDRWQATRGGINLDMQFFVDETKLNMAAERISQELDIPAREPEITVVGTDTVVVTHGENGQKVNQEDIENGIRNSLKNIADITKVEIAVTLVSPRLSDLQLEETRGRAQEVLRKKLKVRFEEDKRVWEIGKELMIVWLDPQGGWKRGKIEEWVLELAGTVDRLPENATFQFLGGGRVEEFRPAKSGYEVEQGRLTDEIIDELNALEVSGENEKSLDLPVVEVEPQVTIADINDLGIKELLGKGESWYAGSITNRVFNLKKAADALNGVLVSPGETFSFNQTVGEISSATGYRQAYIIKEGKTILGDGGGVCQTSSTLFRAVLASGLPIDARTAHAYRVSYYEQNYQVGFDATVFQPAPDFKFSNDTPGYILIQTHFDEAKKYLAFSIYGTSDGRKAEISKARVWDVVPPPPDLYIDDPNTPVGKVIQTEHKATGAKVAFDWKVTRGDEVLIERTFFSNYRPWQAVYLKGTKVN
jgi:vancomycin resistance protein YoaR